MFFALLLSIIACFSFFWSNSAFAEAQARLVPEYVQDCSRPCTRTAIVFVHGITGDRSTWVNGSTNSYWPAMFAEDSRLKNSADIYRIDYDGGLFDGPAVVPIGNSVDGLLDSLFLLKQYSKIVFVAHSLGGNIVRSYLVHVTARYGHKALSRIRLVVTLGTPYEGADLANLARLFSGNDQIRVLRPIDVNDFQQILNKTANDFQGKHAGCLTLRNFAAYEKLPETAVGIVVGQTSATRDAYRSEGFDKSHTQLSKPADEHDPIYAWILNAVHKCADDDDGYCPARIEVEDLCRSGDFK